MKRLTIAVLLLLAASGVHAQKTDQQAIELARQYQAQGMKNEQIFMRLQQQGVTTQQMQRIRQQYENGTLTLSAETGAGKGSSTRLRSNPMPDPTAEEHASRLRDRYDEFQRFMPGVPDSIRWILWLERDTLRPEQRIYGHDIFRRQQLTFAPDLNIPTPDNYVLGPGDELDINIYGSSELDMTHTLSPEGSITVRGVGPVSLNGLTIKEARTKLRRVLGGIYGGLLNGTAHLKLSLGNIRSIQVNVLGEVAAPGTYTLPSLASAFHALYAAGGVTDNGSLRSIRVVRNGRTAAEVDVYALLLTGDTSDDVILQSGDVVLVPNYHGIVDVPRGVKRPMRYEVRDGETLAQVIDYAGGFLSSASSESVSVLRRHNREQRVYNVADSDFGRFSVQDGDSISIASRYPRFENRVVVEGAVYKPGVYAIDEGLQTVKELLAAADGVREDAYMDRALLQRERPDWSAEVEAIDLNKLLAGSVPDIALRSNDTLFVASNDQMRERYTVSISGPVGQPDTYPFAEGMSIKDLVVRAGGLLEEASTIKVDISRRMKDPQSDTYSEKRSQTFTVSLGKDLTTTDGNDLLLQPFDQVYIRKSPVYNKQQMATISGEVLFAGAYALDGRQLRVSELLARAGGVTPTGFIEGASLERIMSPEERENMETIIGVLQQQATQRDSVSRNIFRGEMTHYPVAFNLKAALDKPGSAADIILQPGDRIHVPEYNGTVQIIGAVLYPNAVVYEKGLTVKQCIRMAGGYSQLARKSKVFVVYINGTAAVGTGAKVTPGCKIVVPMKSQKKSGMSLGEILGLGSTTASLAAVIAAMTKL